MKSTFMVLSLLGAVSFLGQSASAVCEAPGTANKLGQAANYNLFVEKDLEHISTRVDGRVAVGGNAVFRNHSIGQEINDTLSPYALIVGGDLSYIHGSIWNGHLVYGGVLRDFSHYNVYFNNNKYYGNPMNFAQEFARVRDYSSRASRLKASGNLSWKDKGAVISSVEASPVFFIDGNELSKATYLQIDARADASLMINISGKSVALKEFGFRISGAVPENTIFNFYEAEDLNLQSIGVVGSVLAPNSNLAFNSAQIQGNVVVKSMKGNGYVRMPGFKGCLP